MENKKKNCFILLPGFAPDNVPVLGLKKILEKHGHEVIASNFFGNVEVADFSNLSPEECVENISKIVQEASRKYEKIYGIGISLGGALLLEYAKKNNHINGIISIGTPFRLKNKRLINFGQRWIFPWVYPFWKRLQKFKKLRLVPIGASRMTVEYLEGKFIENLEDINVPVLFLHSKKDRITDHRALEEFSGRISSPQKKTTFIDNGGHVIGRDLEIIAEYALEFIQPIEN